MGITDRKAGYVTIAKRRQLGKKRSEGIYRDLRNSIRQSERLLLRSLICSRFWTCQKGQNILCRICMENMRLFRMYFAMVLVLYAKKSMMCLAIHWAIMTRGRWLHWFIIRKKKYSWSKRQRKIWRTGTRLLCTVWSKSARLQRPNIQDPRYVRHYLRIMRMLLKNWSQKRRKCSTKKLIMILLSIRSLKLAVQRISSLHLQNWYRDWL